MVITLQRYPSLKLTMYDAKIPLKDTPHDESLVRCRSGSPSVQSPEHFQELLGCPVDGIYLSKSLFGSPVLQRFQQFQDLVGGLLQGIYLLSVSLWLTCFAEISAISGSRRRSSARHLPSFPNRLMEVLVAHLSLWVVHLLSAHLLVFLQR